MLQELFFKKVVGKENLVENQQLGKPFSLKGLKEVQSHTQLMFRLVFKILRVKVTLK